MARHIGTDNLVPMNKRTKEEQKEIATAGGIASGESRRERKALKEELLFLLSQDDRQEKISLALLKKAMDGDVSAYKLIAEVIGEYQQQQKVDLNLPDINLVKSKCKTKK